MRCVEDAVAIVVALALVAAASPAVAQTIKPIDASGSPRSVAHKPAPRLKGSGHGECRAAGHFVASAQGSVERVVADTYTVRLRSASAAEAGRATPGRGHLAVSPGALDTLVISPGGTYSWRRVRNARLRLYVPGKCFQGRHAATGRDTTCFALSDGVHWYFLKHAGDGQLRLFGIGGRLQQWHAHATRHPLGAPAFLTYERAELPCVFRMTQ